MSTETTDTPRTEALLAYERVHRISSCVGTFEFCRTLERELSAANARAKKLESVCRMFKERWSFDSGQQHTHTWHDWADCVAEMEKALTETK